MEKELQRRESRPQIFSNFSLLFPRKRSHRKSCRRAFIAWSKKRKFGANWAEEIWLKPFLTWYFSRLSGYQLWMTIKKTGCLKWQVEDSYFWDLGELDYCIIGKQPASYSESENIVKMHTIISVQKLTIKNLFNFY